MKIFGLANGENIPPLEDLFACLTPRATSKDPLPRIACLMGGEGNGEGEGPIKIECLWPRISCLMGIRGEESAGLSGRKNQSRKKSTHTYIPTGDVMLKPAFSVGKVANTVQEMGIEPVTGIETETFGEGEGYSIIP